MTGPTIRAADAADLPAILAITNDAILNGTALWNITPTTLGARRDWMEERQAEGFPILVAERAGRVLGFGSYGRFRPHEGFSETVEHSLYVDADARGGGVGRALLAALVAHATEAGRHVMIGGIEAGNAASIALHEQAGFTRAALLPQVGRKFGRWLDLLFMLRQLAPALDEAGTSTDPAPLR